MTYEQELRDRIEYLEAENANLRTQAAGERFVEFFGAARTVLKLSHLEAVTLSVLADGKPRSKEALFNQVYGARLDQPELKTLDVYICKLRKKLRPLGIEIETLWGHGYRMPPPERLKLLAALGMEVDQDDD